MKKSFFFTSLFMGLLLTISAQQKEMVSIEASFELPGISIRAIEPIDQHTLWFAGSKGRYGRIINHKIEIDSIDHLGVLPQFRSIAYNGESVFLLSIENPALLYKINPSSPLGEYELVYQESHEKVFYDSMKFFDKEHGIAMGDPTSTCLSVITTKDAGTTWQKITCDQLPPVMEGEAAFAASNTNIATKNQTAWVVTGGSAARVFKSEPFGESWQVYDTPVIQGGKMTGIFTTDFYDDQNGIIMGGNWEDKTDAQASKAVTRDGGKTWKLLGENSIPGYISCVQYVPDSQGKRIMAVSTEGIYLSNDSGQSWNKIEEKGFYSLKMVDKETAWLSTHEQIVKIKLK